MKTVLFIIVVLISGAFAGLIHGTVNLVLVEPYLDVAIGIENNSLFATGLEKDTPEFWAAYDGYRTWQKSGQILAGVILGTSIGSLFGIVFALSRGSIPGNHDVKKSLILAGIMWFTLYLLPFLKYPANPPTVGNEETLVLRVALYVSFIILSGVGALAFYKLSKRFKRSIAILGYAIFIAALFVVMPDNPDEITAPASLVNEFRFVSVLGVTSFWVSVGLILGLFWSRLEPHKETAQYT